MLGCIRQDGICQLYELLAWVRWTFQPLLFERFEIKARRRILGIVQCLTIGTVLLPCAIEAQTFPTQKNTEIFYSLPLVCQSGFNCLIGLHAPLASEHGFYTCTERFPENDSGRNTTSIAFSPKSEAMASQSGDETTEKSYQGDGYCGHYLSLSLLDSCLSDALRMTKPNAKLTGRTEPLPAKWFAAGRRICEANAPLQTVRVERLVRLRCYLC